MTAIVYYHLNSQRHASVSNSFVQIFKFLHNNVLLRHLQLASNDLAPTRQKKRNCVREFHMMAVHWGRGHSVQEESATFVCVLSRPIPHWQILCKYDWDRKGRVDQFFGCAPQKKDDASTVTQRLTCLTPNLNDCHTLSFIPVIP